MRSVFSIILLVAGLLVGCDGEFTPATLITEPRVIGARAVVEGDATLAWPSAGDSVSVVFDVAFPAAAQPLSWALVGCPLAPSAFGAERCGGEPLGLGFADGSVPQIDLMIPADVEDETSVLVTGVICFSGTPSTDLEVEPSEACVGGTGQVVAFVLPVATADATNRHPEFSSELQLGGSPWMYDAESDVSDRGCASIEAASLLSAATVLGGPEGSLLIEASISPTSLEMYEAKRGDPPMTVTETEQVLLANHSTAGTFEGRFAFFEDGDLNNQFGWEPPEEGVSADGQLVRFYFTLRDGRGGSALITRALCLVP